MIFIFQALLKTTRCNQFLQMPFYLFILHPNWFNPFLHHAINYIDHGICSVGCLFHFPDHLIKQSFPPSSIDPHTTSNLTSYHHIASDTTIYKLNHHAKMQRSAGIQLECAGRGHNERQSCGTYLHRVLSLSFKIAF